MVTIIPNYQVNKNKIVDPLSLGGKNYTSQQSNLSATAPTPPAAPRAISNDNLMTTVVDDASAQQSLGLAKAKEDAKYSNIDKTIGYLPVQDSNKAIDRLRAKNQYAQIPGTLDPNEIPGKFDPNVVPPDKIIADEYQKKKIDFYRKELNPYQSTTKSSGGVLPKFFASPTSAMDGFAQYVSAGDTNREDFNYIKYQAAADIAKFNENFFEKKLAEGVYSKQKPYTDGLLLMSDDSKGLFKDRGLSSAKLHETIPNGIKQYDEKYGTGAFAAFLVRYKAQDPQIAGILYPEIVVNAGNYIPYLYNTIPEYVIN